MIMQNEMIEIKSHSWQYGKDKVLEDINLTLLKNGLYGMIGPNGSGKTTLLKSISRSLVPKKKTIFLYRKDITDFNNRELARKISYVPQSTTLEFEFSVMDIVLMGRTPYLKRLQSEGENDLEIVKNAMQITNTWHLREKNIGNISGGERQRVIIARALAQQSEIMILDEPVSQLDIHHQIEILEILKRLTEEKKVTVILSLHDLNLAAQYCDQLILMEKGRIFKKGNPNEIMKASTIEEVYGIKVHIMKNPITGKPHLITATSCG